MSIDVFLGMIGVAILITAIIYVVATWPSVYGDGDDKGRVMEFFIIIAFIIGIAVMARWIREEDDDDLYL